MTKLLHVFLGEQAHFVVKVGSGRTNEAAFWRSNLMDEVGDCRVRGRFSSSHSVGFHYVV